MIARHTQPAHALHAVVHLLDRAAEGVLADPQMSYPRFTALLAVERLGSATQRDLAGELGVSEPSASRMAGVLRDAGWVANEAQAGGGNRRRLVLTPEGKRVLDETAEALETAFASLMHRAGITGADVRAVTDPLLAALAPEDPS